MAESATEDDGLEVELPSNRFISYLSNTAKFILAQWLAIGFGLSCLFAYFFPSKVPT